MAQEISTPAGPRFALVSGSLLLGGTTTFLCNFAGELLRRHIPAAVYSLARENPLASDFERQGIPVFCEDERSCIFEDRLAATYHRLAGLKPSVVVANLAADSFEMLRYVPSGVIRVGTVQNDDPAWYAMIRHYRAHIDLLTAVSASIKSRLEAMPEFAGLPVALLPYGVPMPERLEAQPPEAGRPLRILYLGRLERTQKRVHLFPGMLEQLKQSGIPFQWTIAGEGPERPFLESAMASSGPTQAVSFTGKVAYAEVPRLLAQHDVFLLVSDYEGLPLSLLEAMGQGLVPVISDLTSGVRAVVDERTGIRVPPEHHAGYVEALVRLHRQREQLRALSLRARERVQREFSVAAMTDRWLAALAPAAAPLISWPAALRVQPMLAAPGAWRFSPLGRCVRRWAVKVRR